MRSRTTLLVVAALVTSSLTASVGIAPAHAGDEYETAKGKSKPIYDESVVEEYRVPTRFGRIYGVVERPVVPEGVKVPVILTYTPYSIITNPVAPYDNRNLSYNDADYYVPRGYARAFFDLVGTNGSGGCYDYGGIRERKTGAAVVDFLGTREWSNGRVGMIGVSYDGTTQWAAAVETPKHLTTIVPQAAIGRWWDYAFSQGVRFESGSGTPYLFDYGFGFHPPTHVGDPQGGAEAMQGRVNPCERIEHNDRAFLPDPVYDEFWDERDYLARIDKVTASVMIEGSWKDINVHPINSWEMWDALPDDHPKRFIMAQQGHRGSNLPDALNIRHAWFDYWLLGLDTGIMDIPQVDSVVDGGRRFQSEQWPPAGTQRRSLELGLDGDEDADLLLTDGDRPVWTDNDPMLDQAKSVNGNGGEADLLFLSDRISGEVRISGVPRLDVRVVTDTDNTWVTPILFDEGPTGLRKVITTGLLNARNRFSLRKSVPLVAGEVWSGDVFFQPTDWVLLEGHRLGLTVASMNDDEALYWSTLRATNELVLRGTRLSLPLSQGSL